MKNYCEHQTVRSDLSLLELLTQIRQTGAMVIKKHLELVQAELRANLRSGIIMAGAIGLALAAGFTTLIMLLVTATMALALVLPAWAAGCVMSGFTLLITLIAAGVARRQRVKTLFPHTRQILKNDIRWTKELLS